VISGEKIRFHHACLKACSIAGEALAGNAKTREKPPEGEILSVSWYTHQYARGGKEKTSSKSGKRV